MKRLLTAGALVVATLVPHFAFAAQADLEIRQSYISFSTSTFTVGHSVRIYVKVKNVGDTDMNAYVSMYLGTQLIGAAQPISSIAGGDPEEVFEDFIVPNNDFNIHAVVSGSSPADDNPTNNDALTPLYQPVADADSDTVADGLDNCPNVANTDQSDVDADGVGDVCDSTDNRVPVVVAPDVATTSVVDTTTPEPKAATTPSTPAATPKAVAPAVATTVASTASATTTTAPTTDDAALRPSSAYGVLQTSPQASFTSTQRDWRTFDFAVRTPVKGDSYAWSFGDGNASSDASVTHAFAGPGTYVITLTTTENAQAASDTQTIVVTFFNLENPLLEAVIGALTFMLLCLMVFVFRLHRRRKHLASTDV